MQVSIVMPSFNSEKFIRDSIESVLCQTFEDFELIIIDDGSNDRTVEIINEYSSKDDRIVLLKTENNGGSAVARNMGIKFSSGRFIAFLDSDDIWDPSKLGEQIRYMKSNNVKFSYGSYRRINANDQILSLVIAPKRVSRLDILKTCSIGCLTVVYDTWYFGKVYMPLIRKRQDLGLWLRLLRLTEFAYSFDAVLASYRVHSDSLSNNKLSAAAFQWKLYREHEQLSPTVAFYYFLHYALNGLLKRVFSKGRGGV